MKNTFIHNKQFGDRQMMIIRKMRLNYTYMIYHSVYFSEDRCISNFTKFKKRDILRLLRKGVLKICYFETMLDRVIYHYDLTDYYKTSFKN